MKIYLRELSDAETLLDFTQDETWVADAVARVDEKMDGEPGRALDPAQRPINSHFSLRKVDDVVVVSGNVTTQIQLVCSRCAAYYPFPAKSNFSALFCKDPAMAGIAHFQKDQQGRESGTIVGRTKGFARHAHDSSEDAAVEAGQDLDITYISEDFIDLAAVLTEQIQLQIPFQPLCRAECKGMCTQCGADMNVGRCPCAKLTKSGPFSVLKDLKEKLN